MGRKRVVEGRDPDMTGAELRIIRTACGVNLVDFGREVGVTDKTVRGWENSNDMRVPLDVADRARAMYTELMMMKQDILSQYDELEPGDEATLTMYRMADFEGSFVEASTYNSAASMAYHALVDDGISVWVEWSS